MKIENLGVGRPLLGPAKKLHAKKQMKLHFNSLRTLKLQIGHKMSWVSLIKTKPGDLVMPDPFGWLFSQNLDYFRPYERYF